MYRFLILFSVLLITACSGDVKEELGLRREAPDEFTVQRKPKLDVPPEFKIRPPEEGAGPLVTSQVRDEAREVLFNTTPITATGAGEVAILNKMGVNNADPDIRAVLNEEYGVEDPTMLERIRSISDDSVAQTLVDPAKERERISENKQTGKPVTEGEVQTKMGNTGGKSIIDKIVGE